MIWTIAKYTLMEAIRNRLILVAITIIAVAVALNLFVSEITITESSQYSLVIMCSLLRVSAVFIISLFVITSLVREMNDKGMQTLLSLPLPRYSYYLGKLCGFSILAILFSSSLLIVLLFYADVMPALVWSFSLCLEMILIVSLSLFFLLTFRQVTAAFSAVMAFYVLSRSISAIVLINNSPLLQSQSITHDFISFVIQCLAYVLPDLDRFTLSSWLIYESYQSVDIGFLILQALTYITLLTACALFDLYRLEL